MSTRAPSAASGSVGSSHRRPANRTRYASSSTDGLVDLARRLSNAIHSMKSEQASCAFDERHVALDGHRVLLVARCVLLDVHRVLFAVHRVLFARHFVGTTTRVGKVHGVSSASVALHVVAAGRLVEGDGVLGDSVGSLVESLRHLVALDGVSVLSDGHNFR